MKDADYDGKLPVGAKRKKNNPSDGEIDEMEHIAMSDEHYIDLIDEFTNAKEPADKVAALKAFIRSCTSED